MPGVHSEAAGDAKALNLEGNSLHAQERYAEALAAYDRALEIRPEYAEAWSNRGNTLQALGRSEQALASFDRALAIRPGFPEALNNRGNVLHALERHDEALRCFDQALSIRADYAAALNNRGNTLRALKRHAEALASLDRALAVRPDFVDATYNRGNVLQLLERSEEALACYERVISVRPDHARALNNRGSILLALKRTGEALASFDRALAIKPDLVEALSNRGNALQEFFRYDEAIACYEKALAIRPGYATASSNLGNALKTTGRFAQAEASYRRALQQKPDFLEAHNNLICALDLMEVGAGAQQAERRRWFERFGLAHAAEIAPHRNAPDPERRLRIGYVSADFRRHSACSIFGPILAAHDRDQVEVYCYSGVEREDEVTQSLRRTAHVWRSTLGMSDDALAGRIRNDAIDILVDLSGHSVGSRLLTFARKPAPVQLTAWGYLTGTGLPTIDYMLADPVLVPAEDRHLFAEEVLDLPCCVCYEPPEYLPAVSKLPALQGKPFTFGCINRPEKLSAKAIALWGRILAALPEARLLVKGAGLDGGEFRENFLRRLADAGIGADRVQLLGNTPQAEHLKVYQDVDLMLDSYPHGGGVSTLEALWMGVAVVTLRGPTLTSRLSASILTVLQMPEWIAENEEAYVRIAAEAARDPARLASLRAGLRARAKASPIGNVAGYCRAVEETYRNIWRRWCAEAKKAAGGS